MTHMRDIIKNVVGRCDSLDLQLQCPPSGNVNAELAIIGDYPGEREVKMREPFVGGAGKALWTQLHRYGIRRTQVYTTNVIKRQTFKTTSTKENQIGADELQHWTALLKWELSQLPNLKYVLILGNYSLQALTGERGVMSWRGSVIPITLRHVETYVDAMPDVRTQTVTGVVSYNPAFVLREPKSEPVFNMDMHKLSRVIGGTFKPHEITHHINPTPSQAIEWMHGMETGGLPIAFDIEIMGGETACVGFANSPHEGMCINFRDQRSNRWSTDDECKVRMAMQTLFNNPASQFVAQNGMFDITWLWYHDKIRVPHVWFDTMLAHHTLYSQLPHNLGFLTAQYTDHPYYKDDGKTWREGGNIDQFWEYNVKDVCITRAVQQRELQELHNFDQQDFFFNHVMRLQSHLALMTVGGLRVDVEYKEQLAEELTTQVDELRSDFVDAARLAARDSTLTINPNSPVQLSKLFFKRLGLVGRGSSTDAVNRQRMYDHPQTSLASRNMLDKLNTYALEAKFLSTYAGMRIDPDQRVRCEYKQTGVQSAPGRLSSSQVMWGSGGNLQNWPERAHHMVEADDGYVYVYFDLSQAEARVVGWLANIETWIEQFERARLDGSYDCHRALASDMFSITYEDVPTYDREADGTVTLRFVAKRCRHGLNYRMQPPRLAETTGLSMTRAQECFNLYHSASPELKDWWKAVESEVRSNGMLVSPKGRVLRIMERLTDDALESIIAFKPQSTIGDHVAEVIYKSHDDPEWGRNSRVALNIHDALIALCRKDEVMQCAKVMKKHAESPIIINGNPLIIPADLAVSRIDDTGKHRWSTIKKVKSLDELSDVVATL